MSKANFISQQPPALWLLAISYAVVIYSYVAINNLLVLYALHHLHLSKTDAYVVFAAFNSLVFTFVLLGGYIAGKFGYKRVAGVGLLFCVLALAAISFSHYKLGYYVGLSIYIVGYGLCTPAFFCLVDLLYTKDDPHRDSGYTIFYLLFNVGSLIAAVSEGYLAVDIGYQEAFVFAAVVVLVGLLIFYFSRHVIQPNKLRIESASTTMYSKWMFFILMALGIVLAIPLYFLLDHTILNEIILWALVIGSCLGIIIFSIRQDRVAKLKLIAFIALCITSICFWALYMMESSLMNVFAQYNVNRVVFGFTIPATSFYALDPLGVITLGIFFSWFWQFLEKHNKAPSLPTKFAAALIAMGIGYWIFALGTKTASAHHLVNPIWIILGYGFLTSAELLVAPIGLSMVGRLSPVGKEGVLMGIWNLFIGFSAIVSSYFSEITATKTTLPNLTTPIYGHLFIVVGIVAIVGGSLFFLLVPFLKKACGIPMKAI